MFFWMLEVSQINAYILYALSRNNETVSLKVFKITLMNELRDYANTIMEDDQSCHRVGRPRTSITLERFEKKKHLVGYVDSDRNCVVCSTSEKRRRTNFVCTGCSDKPHLHPKNCFEVYHTPK